MTQTTNKVARGTVRIYTGGLMSTSAGLSPAYVEDSVDILYETAESFRVEYSAKFKKQHGDLCQDVISKDDDKRHVSYTLFTATDDLPTCGPVKHAIYKIGVMISMKGGIGFSSEKADVLIVEETETHYRLRFAAAFAHKHPGLCKEWVRKDSQDPTVTIVE